MMTAASIEVGSGLRMLLHAFRTNPELWGGRKLTQEEAAEGADVSPVLYRNLENGYAPSTGGVCSTRLETLVSICEFLQIDPDDLVTLGYGQVADELRLRLRQRGRVIIDLNELRSRGFSRDEELAMQILADKYRTSA